MATEHHTPPIDRVIDALRHHNCDPEKNGAGWKCRCPAHADDRPSLSVSAGDDGKVLVKCFAGCPAKAIIDALGLKWSDLWPGDGGGKPGPRAAPANDKTFRTANEAVEYLERRHGKRAADWTYYDAAGKPVGLVVRWDLPGGKKDIRPVARSGDGWRIGAMAESRPLYRLPDLPAADRVIVAEGEKCADAAHSLGFVATTHAGGAEAPGKTDWRPLAGKEVWLFADNDRSGHKCAKAVTTILTALDPPAVVRAVELPGLPEGGDIADWVDAGGTKDELLRLVDATPEVRPEEERKWEGRSAPQPEPARPELSGGVRLEAEWLGSKLRVMAYAGGKLVYVGTVNPSARKSRQLFAAGLKEKVPATDEREVDDQLIALATFPHPAKETSTPAKSEEPLDPWPEPVDGTQLLDEITSFILKYMVLPEHAAEVLALWCAHTYAPEIPTGFTPYISIGSPTRECGKSTLEELLAHLANKGDKVDRISAAALVRQVDQERPTMLIDELDSMLRGDMGEALRGILNTGFYRTGKYTVCVTGEDGNYQVKKFSTFCPKVLAGIGKLWDTVASRSIPIKLKRADEKEAKGLKKIRGDRIAGECRPFASRLLRFVTDIKDQLAEADPGVPEELGARQADIWRPLFAIADLAGGHWPETARAAAVAIHRTPDDEGDFGLVILADLRDLFVRDGGDALFSEWIVEQLAKEEGRPWSEYRNDKPITKRQLANLLKRFDVTPMTVRRGAETQKGYRLEDLAGAFATYLPEPDPVDDSEEV